MSQVTETDLVGPSGGKVAYTRSDQGTWSGAQVQLDIPRACYDRSRGRVCGTVQGLLAQGAEVGTGWRSAVARGGVYSGGIQTGYVFKCEYDTMLTMAVSTRAAVYLESVV